MTGLISLAPTSASAIEAGVYDFVTLPGDTITFYDTDSDGEVDAVRSKRLAAETKHSVLAQNWGGERQHMPVPQVHSPP